MCIKWPLSKDLQCNTSCNNQFSSVQLLSSVVSDSLRPHESQHARPPCPSPTPRVHPNSHPSSQWCHPAISSSVVPFSSCSQALPASESFPMSQLFAWGGQIKDYKLEAWTIHKMEYYMQPLRVQLPALWELVSNNFKDLLLSGKWYRTVYMPGYFSC